MNLLLYERRKLKCHKPLDESAGLVFRRRRDLDESKDEKYKRLKGGLFKLLHSK